MRGWIVWFSRESCRAPTGGMGTRVMQQIRGEEFHAKEILGFMGRSRWGWPTLASAACYGDDKKDVLPGPINSISDLQDTAKMVFKLADTNNDDQISQKEAVDAGNLLVGGFFFRADTNGDGVLTEQEAQQARESLFASSPC